MAIPDTQPLVSSRRRFLATLAGAAASAYADTRPNKALRGIFVIVATPYTESKAVDYEDLAREVDWQNRCGAHGIVWPQMASEYNRLTVDERLRGFEVIADAAKGKPSAVVFGVQGPDTNAALNYLRHAEKLSPDALIAIPPEKAGSLEDYRAYYGALARATERPVFIQDTGPHHPLPMPVPFVIELANAYPNLGYIKEELSPVLDRMRQLQAKRPPMKRVFSGDGGRGMLAEMSQGSDGTMPGAAYTDVYVQVWEAWQAGDRQKAREIFTHLLPLINLEELVEQGYQHMLQRRGVFKTSVSRIPRISLSPEVKAEMDAAFENLKPYLRV
ncbi:MAG TPA: dihydrodipicolinate synthase family protein [Terriglobales bacterium]|nr:dihydrodipicolinate synthase family protein [Terriglobales bacterium]